MLLVQLFVCDLQLFVYTVQLFVFIYYPFVYRVQLFAYKVQLFVFSLFTKLSCLFMNFRSMVESCGLLHFEAFIWAFIGDCAFIRSWPLLT